MNAPFLNPKVTDKKRRQAKLRAGMTRWHRRIGSISALFVLILSVTGIFLSHAEGFKLHEKKLPFSVANIFYGTDGLKEPIGAKTASGWLVWLDGSLYQAGTLLSQRLDGLYGVVETSTTLVVAGSEEILLFTSDGQFIEKQDEAVLPGRPDRLAKLVDDQVILESAGKIYLAGPDFLDWQEIPIEQGAGVVWSAPTSALPRETRETVLRAHGISDVSVHRFVSDLHSGRVLGAFGPFLMDIVAIIFMVLALSGLYLWWRQRRASLAAFQKTMEK